ncbi:unnamed protein product [Acanthosepion pharaonis]|uniref:Uncharacterized protein n=1 Tax=Acanthosepion pharaonis TaxID=158019 RepID=A0A812CEU8_ACAPH|nr:unnamed protein product [Sepia pharaonis]
MLSIYLYIYFNCTTDICGLYLSMYLFIYLYLSAISLSIYTCALFLSICLCSRYHNSLCLVILYIDLPCSLSLSRCPIFRSLILLYLYNNFLPALSVYLSPLSKYLTKSALYLNRLHLSKCINLIYLLYVISLSLCYRFICDICLSIYGLYLSISMFSLSRCFIEHNAPALRAVIAFACLCPSLLSQAVSINVSITACSCLLKRRPSTIREARKGSDRLAVSLRRRSGALRGREMRSARWKATPASSATCQFCTGHVSLRPARELVVRGSGCYLRRRTERRRQQ